MSSVSTDTQVSRNDPCPCGSGQKYKKCCMGKPGVDPASGAARGAAQGAATLPAHKELLQRAIAHHKAGRHEAARQLYENVIELKPKSHLALSLLGRLHGERRRFAKGNEYIRRAIALHDRASEYHMILADNLHGEGRSDEALPSARRAIALDPKNPGPYILAANCLGFVNEVEPAMETVRKALALDPGHVDARIILANLERRSGDLVAARTRLETLLEEGVESAFLRAKALDELANVLDRCGAYDDAFDALVRSGAEKLADPANRHIERGRLAERVALNRTGITPELLKRWKSEPFDDGLPAPNFLVGFPRSGTTMTEQVLAAHPDIETSDEHELIRPLKIEMARTLGFDDRRDVPAMIEKLDRPQILELRSQYWREAEAIAGASLKGRVFVDKLPLNILEVGLIDVLFPEAKVIVALRDPRDVCLSCFMQRFRLNTAMINFLDWEDTAACYAAVMGQWLHQRDLVSVKHIEVRYEDTVRDLEAQARRVLLLLGVDWNPAVLDFHRDAKKRVISTPSFEAVTEPVHTRAIGRWRNYERHYESVIHHLEPYVAAFGYE